MMEQEKCLLKLKDSKRRIEWKEKVKECKKWFQENLKCFWDEVSGFYFTQAKSK
jgi:hypothetical protein